MRCVLRCPCSTHTAMLPGSTSGQRCICMTHTRTPAAALLHKTGRTQAWRDPRTSTAPGPLGDEAEGSQRSHARQPLRSHTRTAPVPCLHATTPASCLRGVDACTSGSYSTWIERAGMPCMRPCSRPRGRPACVPANPATRGDGEACANEFTLSSWPLTRCSRPAADARPSPLAFSWS